MDTLDVTQRQILASKKKNVESKQETWFSTEFLSLAFLHLKRRKLQSKFVLAIRNPKKGRGLKK
jgi:hypothetical protein